MKRNVLKVMTLLIVLVLGATIFFGVINSVNAADFSFDDSQNIKTYKNPSDNTGTSELLQKWLGAALVVVQVVGVGVAVIMLVVLAIKYISAAPSDKADIKKHAVIYVVGAIVLFAASGILGLIRKFASEADSALKD